MAEETSADILYSGNYSNFIINRTDYHRPLFEVRYQLYHYFKKFHLGS